MSSETTAYRNTKTLLDNARSDAFGALVTQNEYTVGPHFVPNVADLDWKTLEHRLTKVDGNSRKYIVTRINEWPTLVSQEEEAQTGKKVTTTRTFHSTEPDIGTTGVGRFVESVKQVSTRLWAKTVREIDASILTDTFYEQHPVEFYFPPYLDEDEPFVILQVEKGQSLINTIRSASQRLRVPCLFEITYLTSPPALSDVFQFKPVDIELRTPDGVVSERGVITDGATISFNLELSDAEKVKYAQQVSFGSLSLSAYLAALEGKAVEFDFPPSSPSTTEYKALMGTNVLIADDVTRWKFNLYRRAKVWMKMPNLALNLDGSLSYS